MNTQTNIACAELTAFQNESKGEIIYASMCDIFHILKVINEEGVPPQHALEAWTLKEQYLHNRTIGGNFEFDAHYVGPWIIEKIKQYKPKPKKNTNIFYT